MTLQWTPDFAKAGPKRGKVVWRSAIGEKWRYSVYESIGCKPECWWTQRHSLSGPSPRHTRENEMIRQTTSLADALAVAEEWER